MFGGWRRHQGTPIDGVLTEPTHVSFPLGLWQCCCYDVWPFPWFLLEANVMFFFSQIGLKCETINSWILSINLISENLSSTFLRKRFFFSYFYSENFATKHDLPVTLMQTNESKRCTWTNIKTPTTRPMYDQAKPSDIISECRIKAFTIAWCQDNEVEIMISSLII